MAYTLPPLIRSATLGDLPEITAIYNDAIARSTATFDTEPKSTEQQLRWFEAHGPRAPVLVAESSGVILGWASLSPWSDRCAYSDTVENSVYVRESAREQGTGSALLGALLEEGRRAKLHTVIARIVDENASSIRLHERYGFERIGVMREVGKKFGRLLDVLLMQKIFRP